MPTAHAMYPATRRRRCGTEADTGQRRRVRIDPPRGPEVQLPQVVVAAGDRAAPQVRIQPLQMRGEPDASFEDDVAEAGRKALDLPFDCGGVVVHRVRGDVAVAPRGV